jgi:hypothetical protein
MPVMSLMSDVAADGTLSLMTSVNLDVAAAKTCFNPCGSALSSYRLVIVQTCPWTQGPLNFNRSSYVLSRKKVILRD